MLRVAGSEFDGARTECGSGSSVKNWANAGGTNTPLQHALEREPAVGPRDARLMGLAVSRGVSSVNRGRAAA